jgi:hypothetical protein
MDDERRAKNDERRTMNAQFVIPGLTRNPVFFRFPMESTTYFDTGWNDTDGFD